VRKILILILSLVLAAGIALPMNTPVSANTEILVYLGMNANVVPSGPFSYAKVRLATYIALNRDAIAVSQGGVKVVSIAMPSVSNPLVDRGYDPALADQLLLEASYPDGFVTTLTTTPNLVGLANTVRGYLLAVGIDAQIVVMEFNVFFSQLQARNLEFFLTTTPVDKVIMPPEALGRLLLSSSPQNFTGYNNTAFDTLYNNGQYVPAENYAFSLGSLPIIPLYYSTTPGYTIRVQSVCPANSPPALPGVQIDWSQTGPPIFSGTLNTPYNIFMASGNVTLTAPLTHSQGLQFFIFRQWLVGTPPSPPDLTTDQRTVIFSANADKLATAQYEQITSLGPIYPVSPPLEFNRVGTTHTVWVNIGIAVEGIKVGFEIFGANPLASGFEYTDETGKAIFTYTGDNDGLDAIRAYIDSNNSGYYDTGEPSSTLTGKGWVENFLTGGGNIKVGKKVVWTFDGNIGVLPDGGLAGQFDITNHDTGVTYYLDQFSTFWFEGGVTQSPKASNSIVRFLGSGTGSDGSTITLTVIIEDVAEPGAKKDRIAVVEMVYNSPPPTPPIIIPWIGDIPFPPYPPPIPPPQPTLIPISGGNFQIHNIK
jgi:hypothetical protein